MSIVKQKLFLKKLGEQIAFSRRSSSMSQSDLGSLIDMEVPYLSSIENGRQNPTALTLLKIAEGLNLTVAELFPDTNKT